MNEGSFSGHTGAGRSAAGTDPGSGQPGLRPSGVPPDHGAPGRARGRDRRDSKQELLLALLGQLGRVRERPADFAELAGADAHASLSAYLRQRFGDLREWRQLFTAVFPEVLADAGLRAAQTAQVAPAFEAAEAELARRAEAGELRPLDPAVLARVAAATVLGLLVLDVLGDPVVDARWEELPGFLASLWFDGLRSEER